MDMSCKSFGVSIKQGVFMDGGYNDYCVYIIPASFSANATNASPSGRDESAAGSPASPPSRML